MANWWDSIPKSKSKLSSEHEKKVLTTEPLAVNVPINDRPTNGKTSSKTQNLKENKSMAEKTVVNMEDGTVQEFGARQRMLKDSQVANDGSITTRLYFVNGKTIVFEMPTDLIARFACHGSDQKFGDVTAGIQDVDDAVMAVEDLAARLTKGEWSMKREGGGFAGSSVLHRALCEMTGKTPDTIKEFLSGKTQAEKVALRGNPKLRPYIDKIEAEKAAKGSKVDTDSLLDELN